MHVQIAIWDPVPAFRQGVMAILRDAGSASQTPDELLAWARNDLPKVVVLTLASARDWTVLAELRRVDHTIAVIAMVDDDGVDAYVRALSAGAVAVLPRTTAPDQIREAFDAVIRGSAVVPIDVLRALITGRSTEAEPDTPSEPERDWLRMLAQGMTVGQVADHAGYSERMMFRLLRTLYTKMGASNRTQALFRAREGGWL